MLTAFILVTQSNHIIVGQVTLNNHTKQNISVNKVPIIQNFPKFYFNLKFTL